MAKFIDRYSEAPQVLVMNLDGAVYQDRDLAPPWKSNNAKEIAEAVWDGIDWNKSMAVLGSEIDASAGFPVKFIQLWKA